MADPFPPDYDRATGVAWMTEQVGGPPDDPFGVDVAAIQAGARLDQYAGPHYVASARFSVHVESDILRDGYAELHEWAELAEALELARARATRVIVRLADGREYSAGEEEFDTQDGDLDEEDDQLLPWPAEGLTLQPRRLAGWEFLDRTEDDDPTAGTSLPAAMSSRNHLASSRPSSARSTPPTTSSSGRFGSSRSTSPSQPSDPMGSCASSSQSQATRSRSNSRRPASIDSKPSRLPSTPAPRRARPRSPSSESPSRPRSSTGTPPHSRLVRRSLPSTVESTSRARTERAVKSPRARP